MPFTIEYLGRELRVSVIANAIEFRVVGAVSFVAYGFGSITMAIWMGKPWNSVAKDLADALIYGLLSAGIFGWLWPR